ncbi:PEGA domain-containing protein [Haliangium sp.]|uniref:PEGA domain-containing protein n=1 Tax=Haliangium sp. TaxID=2663208 RepID=UPI003D09DA6C
MYGRRDDIPASGGWSAVACRLALGLVLVAASAGAETASAQPSQADHPPDSRAPAETEPSTRAPNSPDVQAAPDQDGDTTPWSRGVTPAQKQRALALYRDGNLLLAAGHYEPAAKAYREALRHWEHPGIYYNLTLALRQLGEEVAAYHSIERALAYGPAALEPDEYRQALVIRDELVTALPKQTLSCATEGAEVHVDGELLFVGPDHWQGPLAPGTHRISVRREGFQTIEREVVILPDRAVEIELTLTPLPPEAEPDATSHSRGWIGVPGALVVVGALAAGAGSWLDLNAARDIRAFDDEVSRRYYEERELVHDPALRDRLEQAQRRQRIALGLYGGSVLLAATGLTLWLLGGSHDPSASAQASTPTIAPVIGPTQIGLATWLRF